MMEDFIGTYGNRLIVAVVGVGVALLLLAIILWFVRRRSGSAPFIRGGKNRQPRLQVLDATAVDARRRLVLVRRDNVEHLVMIGGPTDIVIESGIGAIPIVKDIRDPQQEVLQALSAERAISADRTKPIPPSRDEEVRPALATPSPVSVTQPSPQPEQRQAATTPPSMPPKPVAASPSRQSAPASAATPLPASPPVQPAISSRPLATTTPVSTTPPKAREQEVAPAIPRTIAREPVAPAIPTPASATTLTKPAVEPEQSVKSHASVAPDQPAAITPPPSAPEPVAAREQAINQQNAVDFLDAARERVLPTFQSTSTVTASAAPKKEPLAPSDNGPVFGDQLTSDFESFLEAEIAKNNAAGTPSVSFDAEEKEPQLTVSAISPPGDGPEDRNVQKEMERIFGEMSVTRER